MNKSQHERQAMSAAINHFERQGWRVCPDELEMDWYNDEIHITYPAAYWGEQNEEGLFVYQCQPE